jgi:hypothetical protein
MTDSPSILSACRAKGIVLTVDGDRLRWKGPKGAMDGELAESIKAHKAGLIRLLMPLTESEERRLCESVELANGLPKGSVTLYPAGWWPTDW